MRVSNIALSYSKALYDIAKSEQTTAEVFEDLHVLKEVFTQQAELGDWASSQAVRPEAKTDVLKRAFQSIKLNKQVLNFVYLLADRRRLGYINEIFEGYKGLIDKDNGVVRGTVRSAVSLSVDERSKLEAKVSQVTGKQIILTYTVDPSVIGGLVAQVGSYTFDDSIESHLRRLNEELKRRAH